MRDDFGQEIDILKKICFGLDYTTTDKKKVHSILLDNTISAFSSLGYYPILGKTIKYENINLGLSKIKGKILKGRIDLLLIKGKISIAIEIYIGSILNKKCIIKLLSSSSRLSIAIIYPRKSSVYEDKTIDRIKKIKEVKNITSPLLIINVKDKKSYFV